ncbi:hypothetical protein TNCV_857091 [Trichonephila clavipes]|nr:hypothetical protein TNCV_857091 [Trichonephila clavipes]
MFSCDAIETPQNRFQKLLLKKCSEELDQNKNHEQEGLDVSEATQLAQLNTLCVKEGQETTASCGFINDVISEALKGSTLASRKTRDEAITVQITDDVSKRYSCPILDGCPYHMELDTRFVW